MEGVDSPGCRLFRETLLSFATRERKCWLTGRLGSSSSGGGLPAGRIETDGAVWALLARCCTGFSTSRTSSRERRSTMRHLRGFPAFLGVSTGSGGKNSAVPRPVEAADQALDALRELSGAGETLAKELQDWAVANKMLIIDMSQATRVDLATAGLMLNVLSKLQETAPRSDRGANELIRALFGVTG